MMESAIYEGRIRHRRFAPRSHRLSYPLFMLYVDLEELAEVFAGSGLWSHRRPSVAWLRRADYFGRRDVPWAEAVRDEVEKRCGRRPEGAVRLLTNPRTLGLRMNPVSFYYCFDRQGKLEAVVAEVTNTPWDERHLYVVHREEASDVEESHWAAWFDKAFHVSPFFSMEMQYRWILVPPGERLFFQMENHDSGSRVFDATLVMERREVTPAALRSVLLRHPALTARILFWIYLHALLLKWKGMRFFAHPRSLREENS